MPMTPLHLRPMAPYEFLPIPEKINGVWQWRNIRIVYTETLGKHLQILNPRKGLLIPYVGILITESQYLSRLKNPSRRPSPDYLLDIDGELFLDGNPDHMPDAPGCCPASYLDEPADGTNALFNCQIVLLRKSDYPDMPEYLYMPEYDIVPFVEWMTDTPRTMKSQWQTGWLVYSSNKKSHKTARKPYTPKEFRSANCGPSWKTHWTSNYASHESKQLNEWAYEGKSSAPSATKRKSLRPFPPNQTGIVRSHRRSLRKYKSRVHEG